MPRISPIPPSPTVTYPIDSDIGVPYGKIGIFSIYIRNSDGDEKDFTPYILGFNVVKELNRLEYCSFRLYGLEDADVTDYVKRGSKIKFFSETYFFQKFEIQEVSVSGDYIVTVTGLGMATTLMDSANFDNTDLVYNDTASNTIVTEIIGSDMSIDKNTDLGNITGAYNFQNKLNALTSIAGYFQSDWWVKQTHPYNTDYFNISNRRGRIPIVKNFYDNGSNQNCELITRSIDENKFCTDIILIGKDDMKPFLMDTEENASISGGTMTIGEGVKISGSKSVMVKIYAEQSLVTNSGYSSTGCVFSIDEISYPTPSSVSLKNYPLKDIIITPGVEHSEVINIGGGFYLGGKWIKPYSSRIVVFPNATTKGRVTVELFKMLPLYTRFSAVNNIYSKIENDLSYQEEVPFDIAVRDSVSFPTKGIVKIGNDDIGYLSNAGNVLQNCISDIKANMITEHKAHTLIFPTYDATDEADTFLTESIIGIAAGLTYPETNIRTSTTINVNDTSNFPNTGTIIISDEVLDYTGKTPVSFTGCSTNSTIGSMAKPHSKHTRVFEFDSTKYYYPGNGSTTSLDKLQGNKVLQIRDPSIYDQKTLETYASSLLELALDKNASDAGGLVTVFIMPSDSLQAAQDVDIGDTIYVNSEKDNFDGNYEIIGMKWSLDENYGEQFIIIAGNRKYRYIEDMLGRTIGGEL